VTTTQVNLTGVPRTLLVPLACRAVETARPDAILHDPRALELFQALGGDSRFLMGMGGFDCLATAMRVRQFDRYARAFLAKNPGGLVVDIGCGLDTRFNRLDDGRMAWLGLDLPEVIALRRPWLPDGERCCTLAQSAFDLAWLDAVSGMQRAVIFLAEGVFPYFSASEVKPLLIALASRFPGSELVFDVLSPLMVWVHNRSSSVLKESGARIRWDIREPGDLEGWGLHLLERWGYFDTHEPRLGAANLIRFVPPLARGICIVRYRLGRQDAP
jgi:O-methyltransferase involved in polyketide biosynthesis